MTLEPGWLARQFDEIKEDIIQWPEWLRRQLGLDHEVKLPLYALLVAPDEQMREDIMSGEKKISIREGWRDYRVGGILILCCHLEPWDVMADIISVRHCLLSEVTEEEYRADGFESKGELLEGLRRFYKNLTLDSPVTVIRWNNERGKLVDEWREAEEVARKAEEMMR